MQHKHLGTVVLDRDVPQHGLCKGDIGAVVEPYEPDGIEVEFVLPSGQTRALATLHTNDVRPLHGNDVLAVRPLTHAGECAPTERYAAAPAGAPRSAAL